MVTGSDLSEAAVTRARHEAGIRGLDISFAVSDMTSMSGISGSDFDVIAVLDNALYKAKAGKPYKRKLSAEIGE